MSDIKEAIAKAPVSRVTRTPIGKRNVLSVAGKDPNRVYRIINDSGDRVQAFLDAGYRVELDKAVSVGDKRVNKTSSVGSSSQLSVGQGQTALVVSIERELYDEDQAAKQVIVNELEASTRAKALNGTYGKLEITRD